MKFLPFILILFSVSAQAERLTSRIHSVDYAKDSRQPHLIRFENGRVGFLSALDKASVQSLEESRLHGEWLDVELDRDGNFLGAGIVPAPKNLPESHDPAPAPMSYEPTNLESMNQAVSIFGKMRRSSSGQCYNRAHVWTYEEFNRSGLRSMKLFMFFTRSYIRRYRYKWWFHVTPMTYVNGTAMTLDRAFFRGPAEVKTWTDKFIYSKRNCPVIYKYSDYRDHQDTEHCYLHPATMYFWQPRDLENYELTGAEKKQFIKSEINWAYWNAF
jgi:hypothetical protein